ncbi:hypothetical protein M8494_37875 [Serratia ureilytica]
MRWWITSSPPTFGAVAYSGAIKLAFAANNIPNPVAFGVRRDQPLLLAILDRT